MSDEFSFTYISLLKEIPKSFSPEKALKTISNEQVAIKITKTARLLILFITV